MARISAATVAKQKWLLITRKAREREREREGETAKERERMKVRERESNRFNLKLGNLNDTPMLNAVTSRPTTAV